MLTPEDFRSLLERVEDETIDFKLAPYDLSDDGSRLALVKDVVCMANTPRESTSFIVMGVGKHPDGTSELAGVNAHPDEAALQAEFTNRVYPIPSFSYLPIVYEGKHFGVIAIPPTRIGPCVPVRDAGGVLRQWQFYFRRGSRNDVALPDDIARILAWFGKTVPSRTAYGEGGPSWERLLQEAQHFDPTRYYVLIASPFMQPSQIDLAAIGLVPYAGVIDFDPDSDSTGLLNAARPVLESRRSVHLITARDRPVPNLRAATCWYFARGIAGREDSIERGPWRQWQQSLGAALGDFLKALAGACAPAPVTCMVLWYDPNLARHLQSTLEALLASFGNSANIIVITDNPAHLHPAASEVGAVLLDIPLHQFCSGLRSLLGPQMEAGGEVALPSSSGAPVSIPAHEMRWLEEEFDVVHLGVGLVPQADRPIGREFLRGAQVSWFELGLHYDIERDLTERLQRQIELVGRRTARVNLYHAPGAGGTTVARRILWNLHRRFPCCVLRTTDPPATAERLFKITSITGQPVLVMVDGAEVAERKIDELYDHCRGRHIPVVLLQVLRRFTAQTEGARAYYLRSELSDQEAYRFLHVFSSQEPGRRGELEALARSSDPRQRSAFYFGLTAFREDFLGLEPYVANRIEPLNPVQRKIVGFLALSHHYAQRTLPANAFADLLGVPRSRVVQLDAVLPSETLDLLVRVDRDRWRTAHDLIAVEVLQQILWASSADRRLWKQNLSTWAVDFAEFCRGSGAVPSEETLEVARRMFIYRDNVELLGTERSAGRLFSQLIEDIPSPEGALHVLRKLTDLYPDEPHFWAHLGRFHSIERSEYEQALECVERALALEEHDSVLHHMRGMVLRQEVYRVIEAGGSVAGVLGLAKQASASFARARELAPDDDHGYISEVQMLARVLDYAGRRHSGGLPGYLASPTAEPYLRDCLERAEDLLERVRRNREGQGASRYEEDCRAKIDALYGRHEQALQIWDNLLARRDVYAPPVRRQIVWTYLARQGRSWNRVPHREVDRMVQLLEENLREEPHNDTNLRLWVQAVRRSTHPPAIESVIERVGYWRAAAQSLDASYYLYILYLLQTMDGSILARDSATRFLDECRAMARFRRNRTKSFEWLGTGQGVTRLVHHSQLGEWRHDGDFWENTAPLFRTHGRIVRYEAPWAGLIELPGGLRAFFVPGRGGFTRESLNLRVSFFLGFSYDGPRAWEVRRV